MNQDTTNQGTAVDNPDTEETPVSSVSAVEPGSSAATTEETQIHQTDVEETRVEGLFIPYPPPTADPSPTSAAVAPVRSTAKRSIWLAILLALLLVGGASTVTYLLTTDRPSETATVDPDGTPAGGSAEIVPGEEPVADAAAVILPSVVQIQTGSGVGSGVIYDADGLILTAAHVVAGNDTVTVRFDDGEEVEGTVLGGTSGADVAVVEVDRTGLPAAELALDDDPRVGQMAIAVGSPWGLQSTVTAGIISAVNQSIPQAATFREVLQTDAAINPGNSGGPLVDREGRVIGINVSIFSLSGANDGVGFAVPIDVAGDVAERVVAGETIESAFLGVIGENVESGQAGAVITEVTPGTAADEAGLEVDDLVVSIDGVRIQGIADLAAQVQTHRPGSTVELEVVRDGDQLTIEVTLGERPADLG